MLPWDEARSDGETSPRGSTDIIAEPPEGGGGDVAVENILLHVLPRGRGATIPGTGRRPGQTAERARTANEITTSGPSPTSELKSTRGDAIFIIPGAAKRHKRLRTNPSVPAQLAAAQLLTTHFHSMECQSGACSGAAPAGISAADISACLPESVGQGSLVTEHLREVSPLSR